ncbi:hypothetical protein JCM25156A_02910 [Komagataeibacter kakiaceti JCM 25156]|uniref:hypothetical protein n=1 Tax=Komagataeibacter kakiaceti TaxID=943261 RepID=UPI000B2CB77A|nr:hypothetical protein [Komagataeibacter kakiaceti]
MAAQEKKPVRQAVISGKRARKVMKQPYNPAGGYFQKVPFAGGVPEARGQARKYHPA